MSYPFSMKVFTELANKPTWFGTGQSLEPLIELLGGPYKEDGGEDWRTLDDADLLPLKKLIWGRPEVVPGAIPLEKRRKYKEALMYIVEIFYPEGEIAYKRQEVKPDWVTAHTNGVQRFIHCTGVAPSLVAAAGGLDPKFSSEMCVRVEYQLDAAIGHEFVFAFLWPAGGAPLPKPPKAAEQLGFAAGGYMYVFTPPNATKCRCSRGVIALNKETAFPEKIPRNLLTPYKWNGRVASLTRF